MKRALHFVAYGAAGVIIGWLAWSFALPWFLVLAALPFLYGRAGRRSHAFILMAGYYLATSRGLIEGAATFFGGSVWTGLALWALASLVFITTYTVLWHEKPTRRAVGFAIALVILSVPPLGIVGWASPLITAGLLMPGTGIVGLAVTFTVLFLLALPYQKWRAVLLGVVGAISIVTNMTYTPPLPLPGYLTAQTEVDFVSGDANSEAVLAMQVEADRIIQANEATTYLFPESAVGWLDRDGFIWRLYAKEAGATIFAGAEVVEDGRSYNTIVAFHPDGTQRIVYRQRMPVPISMWRPGDPSSTHATIIGPSTADYGDRRLGFLICYEQLLIWPHIQSHMAGADAYIGIGNTWWAEGTNIPYVHRANMQAWSRLFGTPFELSMNL